MIRKYIAAVAQINSDASWEINIEKAERFSEEAAEKGAKLIAFPECFSQYIGGRTPSEPIENSQTLKRMVACAKRNHIWILNGSFFTPSEIDGLKNNSSFLISPEGEIIARYDKMHLFDVYLDSGPRLESKRVNAGNKAAIAETQLGILGLSICYDLRFPELYRMMALNGAQIMMIPSMFSYETGLAHWESLIRSRAIENTCYVIAPNQYKGKFGAYGHSMIVDPWGKILCEIPEGEGVTVAEIDLDYLDEIRNKMPTLKHCRDDVYTIDFK